MGATGMDASGMAGRAKSSLRIAMLCHSTNPRGGVAHALALAEALCARGHEVVVHAPDPKLQGFPRPANCGLVSVHAGPAPDGGLAELVGQRIGEYVRHFRNTGAGSWDLLHAHDGIGANALFQLRADGWCAPLVRTVHHLDAFGDPRLADWQTRSVRDADGLACVSRHWHAVLAQQHGRDATLVGNGVDGLRFGPQPMPEDAVVAEHYRLDVGRPLVLSIGGIEARKNPVRLLQAFVRLRRTHPRARLLMVGGASLLDHHVIQQEFAQMLADSGLAAGPSGPVTLTGPVPDAHIAPLLRRADVVAFPSLHEGFGLVVLEALACGTPVVVSRIAPFTEYLTSSSVRFADPLDPASIAAALREALDPWVRAGLRPNGLALAARMGWAHCAARQEQLYFSLMDKAASRGAALAQPGYLSDAGGCHA